MHKCTKEIRAVKMIRKSGVSKDHGKKLREEIKVLKEMVVVFLTLGPPKHHADFRVHL